jgi:hypothetical protein
LLYLGIRIAHDCLRCFFVLLVFWHAEKDRVDWPAAVAIVAGVEFLGMAMTRDLLFVLPFCAVLGSMLVVAYSGGINAGLSRSNRPRR